MCTGFSLFPLGPSLFPRVPKQISFTSCPHWSKRSPAAAGVCLLCLSQLPLLQLSQSTLTSSGQLSSQRVLDPEPALLCFFSGWCSFSLKAPSEFSTGRSCCWLGGRRPCTSRSFCCCSLMFLDPLWAVASNHSCLLNLSFYLSFWNLS